MSTLSIDSGEYDTPHDSRIEQPAQTRPLREEAEEAKSIVAKNRFTEDVIGAASTPAIAEVLEFYAIRRDS